MNISNILTGWYKKNRRDLPWRETQDPYKIWISEIILQQTRVNQGISYYYRFLDHFPNLRSLAKASLDAVLKQWQGLGYYNRARNLHHTAQYLYNQRNGIFPDHYSDLIQLKGIGPYTAAAIASFAFKEPVAVVDGNVQRVIARLFEIEEPVQSGKGKKNIQEIASKLIDKDQPDTHNQAMIEFGAMLCTPQNPSCPDCPLASSCGAFKTGRVQELPVKKAAQKKKDRFFYYLVVNDRENRVLLQKRTARDVWHSLYEFPLIEKKQKMGLDKLTKTNEWNSLLHTFQPEIIHISKEYKHILSHQNIHAQFIEIKTNSSFPKNPDSFLFVPKDELDQYAVSRLIEKYIEDREQE